MRFPEFFEYIATTENVMKRYDQLLNCDDPEIEIKKPDYSDLEEYFCSNNDLYRFMHKTREISCDNSKVLKRIIRLTKNIVLPKSK
jgi:succinate dehydrogenase flavin-adding protein (antitoxin of CptAB toxin-antitoxin module)